MSDNADPTQNGGSAPSQSTNSGDWLPPEARELVSRANNEAAKYRTELRAKTEEHTSALKQIEALSGEKEAAVVRATAAEKELLKLRVAIQAGVPGDKAADFAALLQGETEEELKAHAETVKGLLGTSTQPVAATDPSQGRGDDGTAGLSPGAAFFMNALRGTVIS